MYIIFITKCINTSLYCNMLYYTLLIVLISTSLTPITSESTAKNATGLYHDSVFVSNPEQWEIAESINIELKDQLRDDTKCSIGIQDLGLPQPVYIKDGQWLSPVGNTGSIVLDSGEQVTISCTGADRTIQHPNINAVVSTAIATCVRDSIISGEGWLNSDGQFGLLTCNEVALATAQFTEETCWDENPVIRVGYLVLGTFHSLYSVCFDSRLYSLLYVTYKMNPANAMPQTGVDRPYWTADVFFPGINMDEIYTSNYQTSTLTDLFGQDLANKYITSQQYLSRGHLAAKADFVLATGQLASFYYINAAPQWVLFNSGNWNSLEQALREMIGRAGYEIVVHAGTFGVVQLRNAVNDLVDIYLRRDHNNNEQIPIPLYFYKVIYDESRNLGTAFVGINNPHLSIEEARELQFCTDHCRDNPAFDWLKWQPDSVDIGYSFCCDVNEFRNTVEQLPSFTVTGLLTGHAFSTLPVFWLPCVFSVVILLRSSTNS